MYLKQDKERQGYLAVTVFDVYINWVMSLKRAQQR